MTSKHSYNYGIMRFIKTIDEERINLPTNLSMTSKYENEYFSYNVTISKPNAISRIIKHIKILQNIFK